MKFPIDRIPSCPNLKFWDFGRIIAIGQYIALSPKIVILEIFYHDYEISEREITIIPYIGNMGLWPD
jgi:hypothetical protein